jgi:hypothetical protein
MLAAVMANGFHEQSRGKDVLMNKECRQMTTTFAWQTRMGFDRFGARARIASFAADVLGVRMLGAVIGAVPGSSAPTIRRPQT